MPASRTANVVRRGVVPEAAGRSLQLAAVWTGVGAALVGAVIAIVAVAVCWLPAAGDAGNAGSALRAGLITFVAGLHGGVTVSGLDSAFLPLGLLMAVAVIGRRAGHGLADAAAALDERDPMRLLRAGLAQMLAFAVSAAVMAAVSTLGTSGASVIGALLAGLIVFALSGGVSFVRSTALADEVSAFAPPWLVPGLRIAAAALAGYLGAGALLVLGSLVAHHSSVESLSGQVGGGWSALPILLLGVLAAPNAAVAAASYLAGPGFAVGTGTTVALDSSPHGRLPAFPLLGAVPGGPAPWPVWFLAVLAALVAGGSAAHLARRSARRAATRWRNLAAGIALTGVGAAALAWQGGGGIGGGRLHAVGASPWQFGLVVLGETGVAGCVVLVLGQVLAALRAQERRSDDDETGPLATLRSTIVATVDAASADFAQRAAPSDREPDTGPGRADEGAGDDKLAG